MFRLLHGSSKHIYTSLSFYYTYGTSKRACPQEVAVSWQNWLLILPLQDHGSLTKH